MTGEQLREELARIAEAAPEVHVPNDLFARGRRATMRSRVLVGSAAVACLALIGLAAGVAVDERAPVATGGTDAGVPDHIYAPTGEDSQLPVTQLDDVGPAVAAYLLDEIEGRVVVITPEGAYRMIELPSYQESPVDEITPLLSPDGTQLAYVSQDRLSTFLALLDLTTGQVRRVPLASGLGAIVHTAQFSPDGDWLAWSGQRVSSREGSQQTFYLRTVGGLIRTATAESRGLPHVARVGWGGLGMCSDGAVVRFLWPRFLVDSLRSSTQRVPTWRRLVAEHGECAPPTVYAQLDSFDRLLGWITGDDEPTSIVLVPDDGGDDENGYSSLLLRLVDHDGHARTVGRVDAGATNVTIASSLVTAERPTVPAGPSPWAKPWIVEHWRTLVLALGGAVLAILIVVRARAVRR